MTEPPAPRMHADEVDVGTDLVKRLLVHQFPQWGDLRLSRVGSSGTDHAMFRLGRDLVVRLPRIGWAEGAVEHEQRWLPRLAPHLPVGIPVPVGHGVAAEGYPWQWSVYTWLDGANPVVGDLADPVGLACDLVRLVRAFRGMRVPDAQPAGRPFSARDPFVWAAIDQLAPRADAAQLTRAWHDVMRLPEWRGTPVWMHGDLASGNLLLRDHRLTGLIDFSGVGMGDPAGDLVVAWNLLPRSTWPQLREGLDADDETWARTSGYAFGQALVQLPYYRLTNVALAASARFVLRRVLAERGETWRDDLGRDEDSRD